MAIALKDMMESVENRRMFSNLMTDILPFVSSVGTEKLMDRSIILTQNERYFRDRLIPATLISDGTINVTALIAAHVLSRQFIDNHRGTGKKHTPVLIARIADMLKEASDLNQIIVTTHSPELIRTCRY